MEQNGTPHLLQILVGRSAWQWTLPGLPKQPGRALPPRHLEQPSLIFNLLCRMYVSVSFLLSVFVLIAQLSRLTGIGKENFWKIHH